RPKSPNSLNWVGLLLIEMLFHYNCGYCSSLGRRAYFDSEYSKVTLHLLILTLAFKSTSSGSG
ncbi:MAG TPA: hypothetical protein VEH06_17300, partial [Candidatus Bathyarchaeia archaeon]|nr:hypothetical protein [Candidatus Bathyarchaeia archaeon]